MIILNLPQNPIGNQLINVIFFIVFSFEELDRLAETLKKYPQVIVCEDDAVYHHGVFDDYLYFHILDVYNSSKIQIKECMYRNKRFI
ncbi:unnamed protein product [Paramecium pentaurelia]|uniref:Uncharacterized protein n=1 Tax=Paramecium pentaurelia TaxID=43138 RepID=A0A8S1UWE9_9CILI|nr:unnamed protein product [Paramecium pentaurelia]